MRRIMFIVCIIFVVSLVNCHSEVLSQIVDFEKLSPRIIALKYIIEIGDINGWETYMTSPYAKNEALKGIDGYSLNDSEINQLEGLIHNVAVHFSNRGTWTPEGVIAYTEKELRGLTTSIDGISGQTALNEALEKFENEAYSKGLESIFKNVFGESLNKESEAEIITVNEKGRAISETDTRTLKEWLRRYWITSRKGGTDGFFIVDTIKEQLPEIMGSDVIDTYFEKAHKEGFDKSEWTHVSEALYWAGVARSLKELSARDLRKDGLEILRDQAEAVTGQRIGEKEKLKGDPMEVTKKMIQARAGLINRVEEYIGEKLDISESFDKGLLSSYADGVFGRIRKKYFNSASETWKEEINGKKIDYDDAFKKALRHQQNMIDVAIDVSPTVGEEFFKEYAEEYAKKEAGLNPKDFSSEEYMKEMRGYSNVGGRNWGEAEIVRKVLNNWSFHVVNIGDYTGDYSTAKRFVLDLMDTDSGNGKELKDKISNIFDTTGEPFSEYFKTIKGKEAYAGFVSLIPQVLSRASYFGIEPGNADAAFNATKAMLDLATKDDKEGESLLDKVSLYLFEDTAKSYMEDPRLAGKDIEYVLDSTEGTQIGIMTFWMQVLYAKSKELGNGDVEAGFEDAMDYIDKQFAARGKVREALESEEGMDTGLAIGAGSKIDTDHLVTWNLFESVLASDLDKLDDSVNWVTDYIKNKVEFKPGAKIKNGAQVEKDLEEYVKKNNIEPIYPEYPTESIKEVSLQASSSMIEEPGMKAASSDNYEGEIEDSDIDTLGEPSFDVPVNNSIGSDFIW